MSKIAKSEVLKKTATALCSVLVRLPGQSMESVKASLQALSTFAGDNPQGQCIGEVGWLVGGAALGLQQVGIATDAAQLARHAVECMEEMETRFAAILSRVRGDRP